MDNLIDANGNVRYGLFDQPIDQVNYWDYPLETPMGLSIPWFIKHFMVHQFVFFGMSSQEYMVGLALIDLKYLSNGFFYVFNRKTRKLIESKQIALPTSVSINPCPERITASFDSSDLKIKMYDGKITAMSDKYSLFLDVNLSIGMVHPIRLCSRAGYRGWVYMQKSLPIPVSGRLRVGEEDIPVSSPDFMGAVDWTTGYMQRETYWNWASCAITLNDGRSFGLNLSCGVNETGFTENAFIINNKIVKVDTVHFEFDKNYLYRPWKITSHDRKINLTFQPEGSRSEHINALLIASKFTQLIGVFEGRVTTDTGEIIKIINCPGLTEDHYAKW